MLHTFHGNRNRYLHGRHPPKAVLLNFQGGEELTELHASECNRLEKLECAGTTGDSPKRKGTYMLLEDSITWRK